MNGKFVNQDQKIMIDNLTTGIKQILNNPYYIYTDKKGSVSEYYNINNKKTTLDEATRSNYSELGPNSPIKYNLIHDAFLYGIQKIDFDFDIGDNGLEASDITGEAIVLPNTFIPYPGDFFTLHQINKPYLFNVNKVDQNTLDTGAIMYKISWKLEYTDLHGIDKQVVEEFNMILNNEGTNLKPIIESSKYNLVNQLEDVTIKLKDYFNDIFYNDSVQSYTYFYKRLFRIYDPILIEFIIRNKILKGATKYTHVSQQMYLPNTFAIDYDKTIFSALENKDLDQRIIKTTGNLYKVEQRLSLLYAHVEDYYYMDYNRINKYLFPVETIDPQLIDNIKNNKKYENNIIYDIMIKYFNNEDINSNDISNIKYIDYKENKELYYGVPILIYCIEQYIIKYLS